MLAVIQYVYKANLQKCSRDFISIIFNLLAFQKISQKPTTYGSLNEKAEYLKFLPECLLIKKTVCRYPENCPPRKIAPGQGWCLDQGQGQFQGWGATRQLPSRKIAPRLGLGFGIRLVLGFRDNFPWGQLSQNCVPKKTYLNFSTFSSTFFHCSQSIFFFFFVFKYSSSCVLSFCLNETSAFLCFSFMLLQKQCFNLKV